MHGQVAAISQDAPAIAQQQAAGAKLHTLKRMAAQPLGSTVIVSLRAGFLKLSWLVKELLLKSNTPEPAGRRAAAKERQQVHLMRTWWQWHRQHTIVHMQYKHSTAQHSTVQHSTALPRVQLRVLQLPTSAQQPEVVAVQVEGVLLHASAGGVEAVLAAIGLGGQVLDHHVDDLWGWGCGGCQGCVGVGCWSEGVGVRVLE